MAKTELQVWKLLRRELMVDISVQKWRTSLVSLEIRLIERSTFIIVTFLVPRAS